MLLNQLSLSYKCHSSIGNSLILEEMIKELITTFIQETEAVFGEFYLTENKVIKIFSYGKQIQYDFDELLENCDANKIIIKNLNESLKILIFTLENSLMIFIYDKNVDLTIISSMYESFRKKLNISINSCLNVEHLKEKNKRLEDLTLNLKKEVEKAVKLSKKKEKQFFEQVKMAQMGELIGNIAHQWRQPLSVISTAASGLRLKKEIDVLSDEDFYHYSDSIINNTIFLSKTIDEFRDYIKESHKEKQIIIQDRIKMAFTMVESSYKIENIDIIEDKIEKEPILFTLILGELLQVIIAILNNAREALITSKNDNKWVKYSIYKDEDKVTITIEDNAGGIEKEVLEKIFNPYFTTKHQSQGTGIGLYSSYDIVVNHLGGNLYNKNTKNGAKFYIELPLEFNYSI